MADVFISYSKKNKEIAEGLANLLRSNGYDVWWDHHLYSGDNFREKIMAELLKAKAAIVIWTAESVLSSWVIGEAEIAKKHNKLIPTKTAELAGEDIPLGFGNLHAVLVTQPDLIQRSLDQYGIVPVVRPSPEPPKPTDIGGDKVDAETVGKAREFASWEYIKTSTDPAVFKEFLASYPDSPLCDLARMKLVAIQETDWNGGLKGSRDIAKLREFLRVFPEGPYSGEVKRQIDGLELEAWNQVKDANNPTALREFLQKFPDGNYAAVVRNRLDNFANRTVETVAWSEVLANPTPENLRNFITRFSLSSNVPKAQEMLKNALEAIWTYPDSVDS